MSARAVQLGEVCEFVYGDSLKEEHRRPGKVPVFGSNGIVGWHDQAITSGPTIVIGRKGSIGEINWSSKPCYPIDTTYFVEKTKQPCDLRWLYFTLLKLDLTRLNKSAAIPGLNREDAYEQRIPWPNLSEQKRITGLLEQADRLRRTCRYALDLSESFLPAAFLELFGDPVRNEKGWNIARLEDACSESNGIKAGPFGSSLKKDSYSNSGIRVYGQEQVIAGDFSIGDYYISKSTFGDFAAYEVKPGDVLISLVGTFGRVVVVPDGVRRGIINPRLLKISPKSAVLDSTFLAKFIEHPMTQHELMRMSHGGTMGILNAGLLRKLRIILPPLRDQRQFATLVERHEDLKARQREALRQGDHLFQSVLHCAFSPAET